MFLHVKDICSNGHSSVAIRTGDSDVIVLAIATHLKIPYLQELWVQWGTALKNRNFPIHQLHKELGHNIAAGLPLFHALSGCDQVGGLNGKRKKSFWRAWMAFPAINLHFARLSQGNPSMAHFEAAFTVLQQFICKLYNIEFQNINECDEVRLALAKKGTDFSNMPPSADALRQLFLRATYIAGYVWGNCLVKSICPPHPGIWAYKIHNGEISAVNTTLPPISKAMRALTVCGCTKACSPPCGCAANGLRCTPLCKCMGECYKFD